MFKEKKIDVTFFHRKPRQGRSFSLEYIFVDIRNRLKDRINATIQIVKYHNDGYATKFYNIIEAAFKQGRGVNHVTGEVHFLDLLMNRSRVVLTILDCGMMHRKKGLSKYIIKLLYLTWPIKRAKFVTCISEYTKREIIAYSKCPEDKLTVIPVAVDPIYQPTPKVFNNDKPNILHIGIAPNKNLVRLIAALEGIECHLTIIGKLSNEYLDELTAKKIDYSNEYNISQERMLQKYEECDILSFVSTFEGFGMPIIEANSVERVVITSNVTSMPEIAGDAACIIDPFDIDDIRKGIKKLINDSAYREKLIANGRKNKLRFDGDKIADAYYGLYLKI